MVKSKDQLKQNLTDTFSKALASEDEKAFPEALSDTAMKLYDEFME